MTRTQICKATGLKTAEVRAGITAGGQPAKARQASRAGRLRMEPGGPGAAEPVPGRPRRRWSGSWQGLLWQQRSGRPASGWASPSPRDARQRWTSRSSSPGTPPWSSSCGRCIISLPGRRPGRGRGPDRGLQPQSQALGLPDAAPVAYEQLLARSGKGDSLTMLLVFRCRASAARPCQGPASSAVPDGPGLRGSTLTAPALRRVMAANGDSGTTKISLIQASPHFRGFPRGRISPA